MPIYAVLCAFPNRTSIKQNQIRFIRFICQFISHGNEKSIYFLSVRHVLAAAEAVCICTAGKAVFFLICTVPCTDRFKIRGTDRIVDRVQSKYVIRHVFSLKLYFVL